LKAIAAWVVPYFNLLHECTIFLLCSDGKDDMHNKNNIREQVQMHSILISGAAQGIGAAIAQLFYQQGYRVGIYDIHLHKHSNWQNNWVSVRMQVCLM